AFNSVGVLFVANTANDTVVQIPVADGVPGTPTVFVNSINGPDGLIIDGDDNLWVVANQADEIVVVDPSGKGIAKLGDFDGIAPDGSPRGLLFPASPVFFGEFVYVTNLALDLRDFNPQVSAMDTQRAIIRRAFDLGITHFDLANNYGPPYGSAEENFGRILSSDLAGRRDQLVISTKAGYDMWPGPYGIWSSRKYLLASLDQS